MNPSPTTSRRDAAPARQSASPHRARAASFIWPRRRLYTLLAAFGACMLASACNEATNSDTLGNIIAISNPSAGGDYEYLTDVAAPEELRPCRGMRIAVAAGRDGPATGTVIGCWTLIRGGRAVVTTWLYRDALRTETRPAGEFNLTTYGESLRGSTGSI